MDSATIGYYSKNAVDVFQRYESVASSVGAYFQTSFPTGGRILDVGCGSGRDLAALRRLGYDAYGVEPVKAFASQAEETHPELAGRVAHGGLPDLEPPFGGEFDGVLCSAVLMHIDSTELFHAALAIKKCLKQGGRLLLSVPSKRSDVVADDRDANGRLFKTYQPGYLQLIFERLGFVLISQWSNPDSFGRNGTEWVTLLFRLQTGLNTRPIDQIEGILNNDKKQATYKFALVRALAEIATQSSNRGVWLSGDRVGVPIAMVVEKWIQYYWPLIESHKFIPQKYSEKPDGGNQLKFRTSLTNLINLYKNLGGYVRYRLERNSGRLPDASKKLERAVVADIGTAIWTGPVTYAGGSLATGRVFGYDKVTKLIIIPKDLWIELTLLGHWISQAVILRWGELTAHFGTQMGITVSYAIQMLLAEDDPLRSTTEARKMLALSGINECVWTGAKLKDAFEVDHVIPYTLWRNNDVWNLLPTTRAANNSKRDKLPTVQLLKRRRDCVFGYWDYMRKVTTERFDREAETLIDVSALRGDWLGYLFNQLCESVEITALQRGITRWEP